MKSALLAATAILIFLGSVVAATAESAITITNVNLRNGPGLSYPVLLTIKAGTRIEIETCAGGWCRLRDGASCYVSQPHLKMQRNNSRPN